jgi:predicted metal-dependent phosphotriesterase family hydrolase
MLETRIRAEDATDHFLSELATIAFRLSGRIYEPGTIRIRDEMKGVGRQVEALCDLLDSAGIEIVDHTGQKTPSTGAFQQRVLALERVEGLTCETVIETVKPTVRYKGRVLQVGEVILGAPPETSV